jgi:hypothetical protein
LEKREAGEREGRVGESRIEEWGLEVGGEERVSKKRDDQRWVNLAPAEGVHHPACLSDTPTATKVCYDFYIFIFNDEFVVIMW